jgi:uncharacterized protein
VLWISAFQGEADRVSGAELAFLAAVGMLAGGINAVAGGGSLVLFPALLAVGLPPLAANVTNTVAVWPGYVGAAAGYVAELRGQRPAALALGGTALLGGAAGAVLLLSTDERLFDTVVPFLVLGAALLLAAQARVTTAVQRLPGAAGGLRSPLLHAAVFLAAVYGGYFGGALGVILLAVLAVFLGGALQRLNALRSVLALVVNTVALLAFAVYGPVDWTAVAVAAPTALLGGYLGARVARRLPATALRWTVVVFAVGVAIALL